jgi:DNA polymerase-1
VAGILSGDPYLIETYKKNEDIHTSVAVKMFNKDAKQITKDERNAAKALNFGIFYGMGVTAIKNNLKVERNVAQAFYDSYTMAVNVLMKYLKDTIEKTKETGFTETLYGRQRQVKELFSSLPMIRAQGERIAMNAPIQGTAADIIKWAMVDFKKRCIEKKWDEEKVAFILQIHDELLFEVDEEMKEEVCEELKKVMEVVIEKHTPKIACTTIPLVANIKLGKNWGEM